MFDTMKLGAVLGAVLAALLLHGAQCVSDETVIVTRCTTLRTLGLGNTTKLSDFASETHPIPKIGSRLVLKFQVQAERDAVIMLLPNETMDTSEHRYAVQLSRDGNRSLLLECSASSHPACDIKKTSETTPLSSSKRQWFTIEIDSSGFWAVSGEDFGTFLEVNLGHLVEVRFFSFFSRKDSSATWAFNCREEDGEEAEKVCEEAKEELRQTKEDPELYLRYSLIRRRINNPPTLTPYTIIRDCVGMIKAMNVQQQLLMVSMKMDLEWVDLRLKWDTNDFGGVHTVSLSPNDVWVPEILQFSGTDEQKQRTHLCVNNSVVVSANGVVKCQTQIDVTMLCEDPDSTVLSLRGTRLVCSTGLKEDENRILYPTRQFIIHKQNVSDKWTTVNTSINDQAVRVSRRRVSELLLHVHLQRIPAEKQDAETRLRTTILSRALYPPSGIVITSSLKPTDIFLVAPKEIQLHVNFTMEWTDPRLTWNATEDFDGRRYFSLSPGDLWTPDLYTLGYLEKHVTPSFRERSVRLSNNGEVQWGYETILTLFCDDTHKGNAASKGEQLDCRIALGERYGDRQLKLHAGQDKLKKWNVSEDWEVDDMSIRITDVAHAYNLGVKRPAIVIEVHCRLFLLTPATTETKHKIYFQVVCIMSIILLVKRRDFLGKRKLLMMCCLITLNTLMLLQRWTTPKPFSLAVLVILSITLQAVCVLLAFAEMIWLRCPVTKYSVTSLANYVTTKETRHGNEKVRTQTCDLTDQPTTSGFEIQEAVPVETTSKRNNSLRNINLILASFFLMLAVTATVC